MKALFTALTIVFLTSNAFAEPVKSAFAEAQLLASVDQIESGESFWIALHLKMDDEWHSYWQNPGDSGLATTIDWKLPPKWQAEPIQWPTPKRIDYPELTSYGYEEDIYLLSRITTDKVDEEPDFFDIRAHVTWLSCKKICIPGKADLSLQLPTGVTQKNLAMSELFERVKTTWPVESRKYLFQTDLKGDAFHLRLSGYDDLKNIEFFPFKNDLIDHTALQKMVKTKKGVELIIPKSDLYSSSTKTFEGVVVLDDSRDIKSIKINSTINIL